MGSWYCFEMDNFSISGHVWGCKGFGLHNLDNLVHEIFGVLISANFAILLAVHKNKFPPKNITANIFPAKVYSIVNILYLEFATQKCIAKKS